MASKFVIILSILLTINSASALKCYICNSSYNKYCPSLLWKSQKCNFTGANYSNPINCVKLVGKAKNGINVVYRGCMQKTQSCKEFANVSLKLNNLDFEKCYTCNKDNCNAATKIDGIFGLLAACIFFIF